MLEEQMEAMQEEPLVVWWPRLASPSERLGWAVPLNGATDRVLPGGWPGLLK